MTSAQGRWVLSYNGEIYNFRALRQRLDGEGVHVRGGSDTEVVVEALACWGLERTLDACEGMFAMSVWDRQEHRLHLVRDRLGEKPLYYGWVGGLFGFASELKALRCVPGFSPELDRASVALYLRHNCVPAPRTIYRGIAKLEPGEVLTLGAANPVGATPAPRAYWSARDRHRGCPAAPARGIPRRADRPGGGDVVRRRGRPGGGRRPRGWLLVGRDRLEPRGRPHAAPQPPPVRTFTIGFADKAYDESADAGAVAAALGTDHTAVRGERAGRPGRDPRAGRRSGTSPSPTARRSPPSS